MMRKFWFFLWLRWAVYVSFSSLLVALLLSVLLTSAIFFIKSNLVFTEETLLALVDILKFWMPIMWSLSFVFTLLWSLKKLFNVCINGYQLQLYDCDGKTTLSEIAIKNLRKLWRKWLFALIWTSATLTVLSVLLVYLFTLSSSLFGWFSVYWLFAFVMVSGFITLPLMAARCKMVKVVAC